MVDALITLIELKFPMAKETMLQLTIFTIIASITPGPGNLMLLTSGANFGIWRSLPYMWGIFCGYMSLLTVIGFGIGSLFTSFPSLQLFLKIAGSIYLLYLAIRIALSHSTLESDLKKQPQPFKFVEGTILSWLNPKAWVLLISVFSIYVNPQYPLASILLVIIITFVIDISCSLFWVTCGTAVKKFLSSPIRIRCFNISMGLTLAIVIIFILYG